MRFEGWLPCVRGWWAVLCLLPGMAAVAASGAELKYDAHLIWATNADKSPDPSHKPVGPDMRKEIAGLPLKWANYFIVKSESFSMPQRGSKEVVLSDKCKIEVKDIDGRKVEVSLVGKGEPILRRTQPLGKGKILVLGGNAPDATGWLVILKRVE